jgi:hypothetical protein
MSEANRESVLFVKETTWGTTPSANGKKVNFTNCTLGNANERVNSKFIRDDANVASSVRTAKDAVGDLGIELQYGAYDQFLEAVCRGSFGTTVNLSGTTFSTAASDNSINDSGAGFGDVVKGQWIKVAGFTTSGNNGYFRVATKSSSSKLILEGGTLVDEAAGDSVTVKGTMLKNGTTDSSFSFERQFASFSGDNKFGITGLRVSELALTLGTSDISNGSISFMGKEVLDPASASIFSGTTAADTTESMNTVDHIAKIFIDDAVATTDILNMDLQITNNAEKQGKLGQLAARGIRTGTVTVSGNFGEYFEDDVLLTKSFNNTPISITIILEDSAGNAYAFDIRKARIDGNPDNPGIDQDITVPYAMTAEYDSDFDGTIGITRFPA